MSAAGHALPLAVVGCDFRVASSSWRSRLVLADAEAREIAAALERNRATDGFVDLNTCNRTEWIVSTRDPGWAAPLLSSQMIGRLGPGARGWFVPYVHVGDAAARHVFRVALGQESLVVGERQIAGQLHEALERARARDTSSRVLNGLGTVVGRLVRLATRTGCRASASTGVHGLAVAYLSSELGPNRRARVAVVGLGQIGRRVLGLLEQDGRFAIVRLNRTVAPGMEDRVRPLAELPRVLEEVDAVLLCTGAPGPVLVVADLPRRPARRPLLIVDVGIPEQLERGTPSANVIVAGLDQLTAFHRRSAGAASDTSGEDVEPLVQKAVTELRVFCNQPTFSEILDTVQRRHRQAIEEGIPRIIADRLGYLSEKDRARLARDLHAIILGYTTDMFQIVRQASEQLGKEK